MRVDTKRSAGKSWKDHIVDNATFWNERYRRFPQLGSGPGSRGYAASYKNALVKEVMIRHDVRSIVDIGCGDLCWLDQEILEGCRYVGLDVSTVAVERARAAYPSLQFAAFDVTAQPVGLEGDLVVSFDVLIHQIDIRSFQAALGNTLAAIGKIGLVSYTTPPMMDGSFPPPATLDPTAAGAAEILSERRFQEMITGKLPSDFPRAETTFHEPLPVAVAATRPDVEISIAGRYRYQTVYAIRAPVTAER
jgi:hypothetical protein